MAECADTNSLPGWKEAERLAALYSFEILDTEPETAFDSIAKIAAHVCNAPIAMINFIDAHRQWFKSQIGVGVRETSLDVAVCTHAIRQPGVFVVPDMARDLRFSSNPHVTGEPYLRFYASIPLQTRDGLPLGTLCVLDHQPRREGLTEQQSETLTALAQAVMGQLELKQANKILGNGERKAKAITEAIPQMVWSARADGFNDYYNRRWYEFTGLPIDATNEVVWSEIIHPEDYDRSWARWRHSVETGEAYETQYRLRHRSGAFRWILARALPIRDERGRVESWYGTYTDIHERMQTEEVLSASEERLRLALNAAHMVAWEVNLETRFTKRSDNSIRLLGIRSGPHKDFIEGIHPEDRPAIERFFQRVSSNGFDAIECRYTLPCGQMRWLGIRAEKADRNRIVGVTFDITHRKEAEEELRRSANYDFLTGLPNRFLFQRRLEEALADAKQIGASVSLLLIDLDHFKDVNDTLGHDVGDALLKEIAARLSAMIRDCDTVARLGEDEFAILVVEPLGLDNAMRLGSLVIETLRQPFNHCDRTIITRASIGVATYPDHDAEAVGLVKDANIALDQAKKRGRHRVVTYSPAMRRSTEKRVSLIRDMREAIAGDRIAPFYQPRVCLLTGRIIGFEALARWQHPNRGLLTPAFFGSTFDDAELATALGKLMTEKIVADMRQWLDRGLSFGRIALNLSQADFSQPRLADRILRTFHWADVPTEHLEIEVPETVLLGRTSDRVSSILEQFHRHGVKIALDDFGTGYASLTHLKRFPVDHVKIDRSFVRDLEQDADDEAIVTAIIGLGKSLGLHVTAEGVETPGQAQRLCDLGCDSVQGYFYARPLAGLRVPDLLTSWGAKPAILPLAHEAKRRLKA